MTYSRSPKTVLTLVALLALFATGACGGGGDDDATTTTNPVNTEPAPTFGAAETVVLKNVAFDPAEITIKKGQQVRWLWQEKLQHNVVGEGFKSETMDSGEFEHTFNTAGEFPYVCTLHPTMKGKVTVE